MVISKAECADIAKMLPAAASSSVLPILECVRVGTDGDNGVFFEAGNLQYVATYIFGSGELPDLFINAKLLKNALKSPFGGDVKLSSEHNRLVVANDSAKVKLNSAHELLDAVKYEAGEQSKVATIPANVFKEKLEAAVYFASNDELRPAMTYVAIEGRGTSCTFIATDAHRLYFDECSIDFTHDFDILVPKNLCKIIAGCLKGYNGDVLLYKSKGTAFHRIAFGNYTFDFRVFDGRYPSWRVVLKPEQHSLFVNRQLLKNAFYMANAFANSYNKKCSIKAKVAESFLTVSTHSDDYDSDSSVQVPLSKPCKTEIDVSVNAKFFLDILKTVNKKDDACKISITGNSMSALIIDNKVLLMPLTN